MSFRPRLECWFEFASTYSYVGVMRAMNGATRAAVDLVWKPFLLGPLFRSQLGIQDSPFNVNPIRGRYMWRDLQRLCEKYGFPFKRPTVFPRHSVLVSRVAILGAEEPWGADFIQSVFRANFAEDREISDPSVVAALLDRCGVVPKPVLEKARSEEVKAKVSAQTEQAANLGVFGAPNFIAKDELFFGQDRLDDAIAWALR